MWLRKKRTHTCNKKGTSLNGLTFFPPSFFFFAFLFLFHFLYFIYITMGNEGNKFLAQMSTDIEEARSKATFNTESLLYLLRGGKDAVDELNKIRALAESEPVFSKANTPFQSRQEVCHIITTLLLLLLLKALIHTSFIITSNCINPCLFQSAWLIWWTKRIWLIKNLKHYSDILKCWLL